MPSELNYTGEKIPAAGYFGQTKGLHTISITVHNFKGRLSIQGSQALNPTEDDWFVVPYPELYAAYPYIQYPRPVITCNPSIRNPNLRGNETSTIGFSFRVNCLWLRATVNRDYLRPVSMPMHGSLVMSDCIAWLGHVDKILVNF